MNDTQKARLPLVVIGACAALTVISFFDQPVSLLGVGLALVLLGIAVAFPTDDETVHRRVPAILIVALIAMMAAVLLSAKLDASIKAAPHPAQT